MYPRWIEVLMIGIVGFGWAMVHPVHAMTVSQLNVTNWDIQMDLGGSQVHAQSSTPGAIVMGSFQPPPVIPDISGDGHTFSLFSQPGPDVFPAPSAEVSGNTITADLQSLFSQITGPLVPNGNVFLNIGPQVANYQGQYDQNTGAFQLQWVHLFSPSDFLDGVTVDLGGTSSSGPVNPVPLPMSAWMFGTGLMGLAGVLKRQARKG